MRGERALEGRRERHVHEVANHTWAHSDLTRHGEAFDRASLECTHELLTRLAGRAPTWCGAPDGRINSVGLAVCASLRYDVSGADMLLWWESDAATKLAVLYLESMGNPRKFARTARRVGRAKPVLTVIVGRSVTGRRLAGARAAAATPLLTRQALFEQAGVIAVANLGEMLDTAVLLAAIRAWPNAARCLPRPRPSPPGGGS